jgi:hypothetical protein
MGFIYDTQNNNNKTKSGKPIALHPGLGTGLTIANRLRLHVAEKRMYLR